MSSKAKGSNAPCSICCLAVLLLSLGLSGCKGFFTAQGTSNGGGGNSTPVVTGDYLYVANGSNTYLAGFGVSSTGTLSVLSGSPYNNGVAAFALTMAPNNVFLYISTSNGIYEYALSSNGTITIQNSGSPVAQDVVATAMQVDATGSYLLAAGISTSTSEQSIGIYQINSSTGLLTEASGSPLTLYTGPASSPVLTEPTAMLITPNNSYVYVSLGTLGVQLLTLGSGGALSTGSAATYLPPLSTSSSPSDYGLASDPNTKYLFVAELNTGLRVLSIGTNGALSAVSGSPYATGTGPTGVLVDPTGSYVYVANKGSNNINGFSLNSSSGALAAISGSPFSSVGQVPIALVNDNSSKFVAVINSGNNGTSGNNDLQMFSYSSTTPGALVAAGSATTGTDPTNPTAVAATLP